MKRPLSFLVLIFIMSWCAMVTDSAGLWAKYVVPDGSYSFHYPTGWKVSYNSSIIAVDNKPTDEQLLLAGVPFDPRKSPTELAAGFVALLKDSNPNVRAFNWQTEPKTVNSLVLFELSDEVDGKKYSGAGYVAKTAKDATWFSYIVPVAGFSKERCLAILEGFIGSLASGSASKAPAIDYAIDSTARIERNAAAFMFVLEFALGAPFTDAQERVILGELESGWRTLPEGELQQYDQYPVLVQSILKMGQKDLEELRISLEKTVREWLAETDQSDRAVKVIRDQLLARGRVVISGDPPLTEMSLTAYSEIIAFSRLLRQDPKAMPEQISQGSVTEIKNQVIKIWRSYSRTEQQGIATSPGMWICLRVLLRNGIKAEQDKIRNDILKLSAEERITTTNTNSGGQQAPMSMAAHNTLMAMQQSTFNSYMWSRGFSYQPATGKMW